jgi:hypothetical protein
LSGAIRSTTVIWFRWRLHCGLSSEANVTTDKTSRAEWN